MSYTEKGHDPFIQYLITKLIPFLSKYRKLFITTAIVLVIVCTGLGIYSTNQKKTRVKIQNEIFNTLNSKKEISSETLQDLNRKYGGYDLSLEVKWLLSAQLTKEERLLRAADIYQEITERFPDNAVAIHSLLSLGTCLENEGEYEDALKTYEKGLKRYGQYLRIQLYFLYRKVFLLYNTQKYAEAGRTMNTLQELLLKLGYNQKHETFDRGMADKVLFLKNMIDSTE